MTTSDDHAATVSEPIPIQPVFCDGLHTVEVDRRGIARLSLYVDQRDVCGCDLERILAVRLILPAAVLADIAARMLTASQPVTPPPPEQRPPLN